MEQHVHSVALHYPYALGVTVFRTDRDLARFAAKRQAWAADLARLDRRRLPAWPFLLAALLLAAWAVALLR